MRAKSLARYVVLFLAILAMVSTGVVRAEPAPPPPFIVIVHPQDPHQSLDRAFVADAFLKKTTRWPSGEVIKPVDLPPDASARDRFSRDVLKRSVAAVKSYWQQMIFSGRDVPPPELAMDDDVVKFVTSHAGAIGYVSGSARLHDARPVTVY